MMVFFLHARWYYVGGPPLQESIGFVLMNLSRLAVPFFFITSGYLLKMKLESKKDERGYCARYLKKIGKYYIVGSVIFLSMKLLVLALNSHLGLEMAPEIKLKLLSSGGIFHLFYTGKAFGEHLWFLLALFYSVALIYLSYRYDVFEKLLGAALILHVAAILSRTYMIFDHLPIPRDDALFFGLALTATGFYIKKKGIKNQISADLVLRIAILTNTLYLVERIAITRVFESYTPYFWGNYSLLTAPAAITVFLYFLKKKDFGLRCRINGYGKKTLWIYILHPIALGLIMGIGIVLTQSSENSLAENIMWSIGATLIAYFGLSEIVMRSPMERLKERLQKWKDK